MSCHPSPGRDHPSNALQSFEDVVNAYRARNNIAEVETRREYAAMTEQAAIISAANLRVLRKSGEGWKRHDHFNRGWFYAKYAASFRDAERALLQCRAELRSAARRGFDAVLQVVSLRLREVSGLGELAYYDITQLLGFHFGFEPGDVYLHAGTRMGAIAILGAEAARASQLPTSAFPAAFNELSAGELEDVLCIFKEELQQISRHAQRPA